MKKFLGNEPYLYQLTIHRQNYNNHYGHKAFERDYKYVIHRQEPHVKKAYATMSNFINYYKPELINLFLTEVAYVQAG